MFKNSLKLQSDPIRFGTDGWRGVLGVDITLERLLSVATAATQELAYRAPKGLSNKVIIGYDQRFLAPEFAAAISCAVRGCELEPLISETPVTTPACSWAVVQHQAIGALVVTASHNPPEWLGLKIKGPSGCSVDSDFTQAVEHRLLAGGITMPIKGITESFNCREQHIAGLKRKFDIEKIANGLKAMGLKVIIDYMHGSAAGCIAELFGDGSQEFLQEIRVNRDPLFGGNPPEPLSQYLGQLISSVKASSAAGTQSLGLVFDGDGDRIAAIDEQGRFCSNQLLVPLFIDHLVGVKNLPGCVIKTVSGSDLIALVAEKLGREVIEVPVGFKFIASEMFNRDVLLGGEESGGIGFGSHIPERDALYAALVLLEAVTSIKMPLGERVNTLHDCFGKSYYDRIDLRLEDNNCRVRLEELLRNSPPNSISDEIVQEVIMIDGYKLKLGECHWLMFRFSGTEPLLRIYCEAPTPIQVEKNLAWARQFAVAI